MDAVRILLADDHAIVRDQLSARLAREPGLALVGEASSSSQVIESSQIFQPHILLIDPIMRDGLGVEVIRQIALELPAITTVVLTAAADTALVLELRRAGVRHILSKNIATQELIETIQKIKNEIDKPNA